MDLCLSIGQLILIDIAEIRQGSRCVLIAGQPRLLDLPGTEVGKLRQLIGVGLVEVLESRKLRDQLLLSSARAQVPTPRCPARRCTSRQSVPMSLLKLCASNVTGG